MTPGADAVPEPVPRTGRRIEELDWAATPLGEISLRRRWHPELEVEIYEARLNDEFLMSSLFTVAEVELARLGLARLEGTGLEVVVGGLGLGYTAAAVLEDRRVRSLTVVEALDEVVGWHERGLLPLSSALTSDPRCRFVGGDFFALTSSGELGPDVPDPCSAILVDIDHSPRHLLDPGHAAFYSAEGLRLLAERLRRGGVFALWSDDPPDDDFMLLLGSVFGRSEAHVVEFANPLTGGTSANTVYVAVR
jgi:spermidine synthase